MGQEAPTDTTEPAAPRTADSLVHVLGNGTLVYNGIAVGKLDTAAMLDDGTNARLILNLGWMKAAGLRVTVQGDPDVDRKRGGVVLER